MEKPERSTYSPFDFLGWQRTRTLEITPKFQRRPVWSTGARSYLIDTLIRGFPVPPLYLRIAQSADGQRTVREIVDGQQRIRAVLDFIEGKYSLSKSLQSDFAGQSYEQLTPEAQQKILHFGFITEVFSGITDEEVLQVFARLNTNSVRLNAQELRNGKFFGKFKQTCYELALLHLTFWRKNRIVSEQGIARMQEVELTSELVIAMIAGMQDKKKSISDFYAKYDEKMPEQGRRVKEFEKTIDEINRALGEDLKSTEFRRPPLFYTLFLTVYDRLYGLPNVEGGSGIRRATGLSTPERQSLRDAVIKLSEIVVEGKGGNISKKYSRFVAACLAQTDNIAPRKTRFVTLSNEAFAPNA